MLGVSSPCRWWPNLAPQAGNLKTLPNIARFHPALAPSRYTTLLCTQSGAGVAQFEQGPGSTNFSPEDQDEAKEHKDNEAEREGNNAAEASDLPAPAKAVNRRVSAWRWEVKRLKSQLQNYGAAGLLSYGLLNTVYYSSAFLVFWHLAKVPRGLGWSAVYKQFLAIMGVTWAASQLTKIPRAAFALALAPTVDGILVYLQARLRLRTRRNASFVFVGVCLLLASLTFGSTLLWWA